MGHHSLLKLIKIKNLNMKCHLKKKNCYFFHFAPLYFGTRANCKLASARGANPFELGTTEDTSPDTGFALLSAFPLSSSRLGSSLLSAKAMLLALPPSLQLEPNELGLKRGIRFRPTVQL